MQVRHMGASRALEPVASASDFALFVWVWTRMMERFSYDLEMKTREQSRNK